MPSEDKHRTGVGDTARQHGVRRAHRKRVAGQRHGQAEPAYADCVGGRDPQPFAPVVRPAFMAAEQIDRSQLPAARVLLRGSHRDGRIADTDRASEAVARVHRGRHQLPPFGPDVGAAGDVAVHKGRARIDSAGGGVRRANHRIVGNGIHGQTKSALRGVRRRLQGSAIGIECDHAGVRIHDRRRETILDHQLHVGDQRPSRRHDVGADGEFHRPQLQGGVRGRDVGGHVDPSARRHETAQIRHHTVSGFLHAHGHPERLQRQVVHLCEGYRRERLNRELVVEALTRARAQNHRDVIDRRHGEGRMGIHHRGGLVIRHRYREEHRLRRGNRDAIFDGNIHQLPDRRRGGRGRDVGERIPPGADIDERLQIEQAAFGGVIDGDQDVNPLLQLLVHLRDRHARERQGGLLVRDRRIGGVIGDLRGIVAAFDNQGDVCCAPA